MLSASSATTSRLLMLGLSHQVATVIDRQTMRSFSSSQSSRFFFKHKPPPATAKKLLNDLTDARQQERLDLVNKLYPRFVQAAKAENESSSTAASSSTSSSSNSVFEHTKFRALFKFVASTSRFDLLSRMFNDLPLLGIRPGKVDHALLVQGMCNANKVDKAIDWLEAMPRTFELYPTAKDWNIVIMGYRKSKQFDKIPSIFERMRKHGRKPDAHSYNTAISAAFENDDVEQVRRLVTEMQDEGIEKDAWTETALLSGFVEKGELASAKIVQKRLMRIVKEEMEGAPMGTNDMAAVNALIGYACASEGVKAGVETANKFRDRGVLLDEWSFTTLVKHGSSQVESTQGAVELLEYLEDVTGLAAGRRSWSMLMNRVLRFAGLEEAIKMYYEMRDRSVQMGPTMVQPLLDSLLSSPSPESFASAKSLYEDLSQASKSHRFGPDLSIYVTLLKACASPQHPDLVFSRTLIADMRERGIKLDGPTATWHIIALMRASSTFEEAFAAYDQLRALDHTALDRQAYNTILSAFTSLSPPSETGMAPPKLIMEFLSDMRHANSPADSATYSLLLRYYSQTPSPSTMTISHLHSMIKLDNSIDPDTALFNSLMGAYSRVGAYSSTYRIWDSLRVNDRGGPKLDDISLAIYLDTCGFDGSREARKRADEAWVALAKDRLGDVQRNEKHWSSWIEALCRWERYDAAEEHVFSTEGKREGGVGMVETFLKMVQADGEERYKRVRKRVDDEFSDSVKSCLRR